MPPLKKRKRGTGNDWPANGGVKDVPETKANQEKKRAKRQPGLGLGKKERESKREKGPAPIRKAKRKKKKRKGNALTGL